MPSHLRRFGTSSRLGNRELGPAWAQKKAKAPVGAEVNGNYQCLRRHTFDPIALPRLRLHVNVTNGSEQARVFDIHGGRWG